jgi:hypothetical protein
MCRVSNQAARNSAGLHAQLIFDQADEGITFLRNVSKFFPEYKASRPSGQHSSPSFDCNLHKLRKNIFLQLYLILNRKFWRLGIVRKENMTMQVMCLQSNRKYIGRTISNATLETFKNNSEN